MSSVGATDPGVIVPARSRDPSHGIRRQEHYVDDPLPPLLFLAVDLEMNDSDWEMTEVNQSIPVSSSSFAKGPQIFLF